MMRPSHACRRGPDATQALLADANTPYRVLIDAPLFLTWQAPRVSLSRSCSCARRTRAHRCSALAWLDAYALVAHLYVRILCSRTGTVTGPGNRSRYPQLSLASASRLLPRLCSSSPQTPSSPRSTRRTMRTWPTSTHRWSLTIDLPRAPARRRRLTLTPDANMLGLLWETWEPVGGKHCNGEACSCVFSRFPASLGA